MKEGEEPEHSDHHWWTVAAESEFIVSTRPKQRDHRLQSGNTNPGPSSNQPQEEENE